MSEFYPDLPSRFVLAAIPGLYVYPRPYANTNPRVALQKSTAILMRLHGIAVAHRDWSTYRSSSEEDSRVFASASFEQGTFHGDFPSLPRVFRETFPSLGIVSLMKERGVLHPLLPYVLKQVAYAATDRSHPASAPLLDNCEKERAWSLRSPIIVEVCVHSRAFLQPDNTMTFLPRLGPHLPTVPTHPLEHGLPLVSWTLDSVVSLMTRADEVRERHYHTTGRTSRQAPGVRSLFTTRG